jgi:hypothetical protein
MEEVKKKRSGCRIFLISILVIFLIFILTILFLILSYNSWQKDFETQIPDNAVTKDFSMDTLEEKISESVYSGEETVALELTTEEVSSLILNSFQGNDSFNITSVYIEPLERGRWQVYLKLRILDKKEIWTALTIRKEDRETAEIFLEDIYIGKYSITIFGGGKLIEKINEALTSALVTTEENGFLGRMLENIELLETGMVVRMEQY